MSSIDKPVALSNLGTATTGPMPISSGSQPPTAKPRKVPRISKPRRSASDLSINTCADEPSDSWEALPAVIKASSPIIGLRLAKPSMVVEGRLQSSLSATAACSVISPVSLFLTFMMVFMGTISSSKAPVSWPAAVRCWLISEYSSCASREML